ncbi:MAG: hypothetical protein Q8906_05980 [Bacillota bacterium]|nr:hypothetical protein [Bacillota bacterium]
MTVKGLSSNAGITKAVGRPKSPSIGYHANNPKGAYIINYHRDSVNIHKGQSLLRKVFGV